MPTRPGSPGHGSADRQCRNAEGADHPARETIDPAHPARGETLTQESDQGAEQEPQACGAQEYAQLDPSRPLLFLSLRAESESREDSEEGQDGDRVC
jgi:hypothetical protein